MRVVSYNVNGIRAAIKKGLIEWLKAYPVDILCVQETKAQFDQIQARYDFIFRSKVIDFYLGNPITF